MRIPLDLNSIDGYRTFLRIQNLPVRRFVGREAIIPDEYASLMGLQPAKRPDGNLYVPRPGLFDYQRDIARLALRKRKFAVFAECGLGKTLIMLEWVRHVAEEIRYTHDGRAKRDKVLIVAPLMVVRQTVSEAGRFYGADLPLTPLRAKELSAWLADPTASRVGITNYEAITDGVRPGHLGALALDESSMLKSHYGAWGGRLIELGRGLEWKLCETGTPAPNDRIEYANHAVFLDQFPTVNAFLARFFVNRGETGERWELKPHALRAFYRALSHWCIFLSRPSVYGWKDNAAPPPPIRTHVIDVEMTDEQKDAVTAETGGLFGDGFTPGGIGSRAKYSRIGKGIGPGGKKLATNKPRVVCDLAGADASIVWCKFNPEQDALAEMMPAAANIDGRTPEEKRAELIAAFQEGRLDCILTKPKILGFGLNLQRARRHVFSTVQDSYEEYWQAVKRSNRIGSTHPLDVFIPVTPVERPMLDTVLSKAGRVQADTEEQERLFMEVGYVGA